MSPLGGRQAYRATPDADGDSHSSTSNSPARQDYEESDFYAANNDSQSSIGVPTFQDMAVSEEMCEPEPVSPASRLPSEILLNIFSKLSCPVDLLSCLCVSKLWARNCVDQLWHRPNCTTWTHHSLICRTLSIPHPYFPYRDFVKRLNLAQLAQTVNDGSVLPLSVCNRVERLTLTKCNNLTDSGLIGLLTGSNHLLALDISEDDKITGDSMLALAENCRQLQGLNIMGCIDISNESMTVVAENCRSLKRVSSRCSNAFDLLLILSSSS
jgi:F-box and leucine-rich repeat protein GRR1